MRIIDCSTLEAHIRTEFPIKYRRFAGFPDSGPIWDEVIALMQDGEALSHIKFCNDVMKIPPMRTHLMVSAYRGGAAAARALGTEEKQALGAVYGFLFKEVLGYTGQESVSCVINSVKMATRFLEPGDEVTFRNGGSAE